MSGHSKTRFDLIPFEAVGEIADVLAFGAEKYTQNNWCRGTNWGRYFSALCRHIFAWWRGEDKDPETGMSHLAHAGCCLLFLMEYQRNSWGEDDRFTGPDGQEFTKHDGVKAANSAKGGDKDPIKLQDYATWVVQPKTSNLQSETASPKSQESTFSRLPRLRGSGPLSDT